MGDGHSVYAFCRGVCTLVGVVVVGACSSVCLPGSPGAAASPPESHRWLLLEQATHGLLFFEDRVTPDPAALAVPALDDAVRAALESRAEGMLGRNRTIEALGILSRLIVDEPGNAALYELLGQGLVREARTSQALAALLTAARLDPERVSARVAAASCLSKLGRRTEAVAALEDVVAEHLDHGEANARLAASLALTGDVEGARRHLAAAAHSGAAVPTQLHYLLETGKPQRAVVREGRTANALAPEIGPQVRLNTNGGSVNANETTSAAIDAAGEVVAAWNDYREAGTRRVAVGLRSDGGATWNDEVLHVPWERQMGYEGDPMTAADPRTGTLWAGGMSWSLSGGVFVARKSAGAPAFEEPVMTYADPGIDKGWLAAGPLPGVPDSTEVYVTFNYGLQRSSDLGATWSELVDLGQDIGYLPRIGPAGELYITSWDWGNGMWVRRSFDGGATVLPAVRVATLMDSWDLHLSPQIPGDFRTPNLCYLAVSPVDGTLYAVWADTSGTVAGNDNVDLYFTRSTDQGSSWATPWVINGDADPPGDQFFPWLEADGNGHLHLLFYDTRNTVQDDSAPSAMLDAYYSWSDDGGDTWTEYRLTPVSFDSAFTDGGGGQFIGDYLGIGLARAAVFPVYLSTQNSLGEIFTHRIVWPEDLLFADGFESGDLVAWGVVP
jgi:hypothetical protein